MLRRAWLVLTATIAKKEGRLWPQVDLNKCNHQESAMVVAVQVKKSKMEVLKVAGA